MSFGKVYVYLPFVLLGYLEWPPRRDHHIITSSNQLANSDGYLIIPPVNLIPS